MDAYGSAADVLSFNPDPGSPDFNHWLATYLTNGSRPFFLLWEHMDSGFFPRSGPKDMGNVYNRKVFMDNLDFMFDNVIRRFSHRYVTINGRAVIYLWASSAMTGDLAGLFDEVRKKYPVAFIGSNEDFNNIERIKAFDGFMEYSLAGFSATGSYESMIVSYYNYAQYQRQVLDAIYRETGKKMYLIPTFQAAYDDTLVRWGNNPVYAKSKAEIVEHARLIKFGMTRWEIFDNIGPFVVFSELPEGAAVIPSIRQPEKEGRYVGYGTDRIEIVAKFFGRRQ